MRQSMGGAEIKHGVITGRLKVIRLTHTEVPK